MFYRISQVRDPFGSLSSLDFRALHSSDTADHSFFVGEVSKVIYILFHFASLSSSLGLTYCEIMGLVLLLEFMLIRYIKIIGYFFSPGISILIK